MRFTTETFAFTLGTMMLSLFSASAAVAQCGGYTKPVAFHGNLQSVQPRLLTTAFDSSVQAPIVGLWHVHFFSKGSAGIPDGAEIDYGYSTWHSDGTELLNSGHQAPKTSNFCQGIWKQTGSATYKLNHFAISWDPSGTYLLGPANIRETVTMSDVNHYSGPFSIDQYNEKGALLSHVQGTIMGIRLTVDSKTAAIE